MLSDSLLEAFRGRVESLGFDLADLRIGGTPSRPLVQVRIDVGSDQPAAGVTVADCAAVSRALEAWLDHEGAATFGPRYVLEVSSPGLERPLRWHRHWVRFVGREISARLPGRGRVRARIVSVPDDATVVLEPEGEGQVAVKLADIREARLAVDW